MTRQVNDLHAELAGQCFENIELGGDAVANQDLDNVFLLQLSRAEGGNRLRTIHQTNIFQDFDNIFVVRSQKALTPITDLAESVHRPPKGVNGTDGTQP